MNDLNATNNRPKDDISKMIRILVVEDNDAFRDLIVTCLIRQGYQARGVPDSAALYRELIARTVDIVVLDAGLPGDNGFAIASQLRSMQRTCRLGIIMFTSHSDLQARIAGLESGADIFLTKPANPQEIHAHVQSLYRRLAMTPDTGISPSWHFNRSAWKLIAPSGAEIQLTHLEALLIGILANGGGRPVLRNDIISKALQQDPLEYDKRRLEAIVARLRKKIAKTYRSSQPIKVAHSVGYIFTDPITYE